MVKFNLEFNEKNFHGYVIFVSTLLLWFGIWINSIWLSIVTTLILLILCKRGKKI